MPAICVVFGNEHRQLKRRQKLNEYLLFAKLIMCVMR